jgi:hypothetical protein
LPAVAIDAAPYMDAVHEVGRVYREALEFPDADWLEKLFRDTGERWGVRWAEEWAAWETRGGLVEALLPAEPVGWETHPERTRGV